MTTTEKQKLAGFNAAKSIALTINKGEMRRAKVDNIPVNYSGLNINGRMFVLGDTENDINNPDAIIMGKPAREIFGEFTIMYKR